MLRLPAPRKEDIDEEFLDDDETAMRNALSSRAEASAKKKKGKKAGGAKGKKKATVAPLKLDGRSVLKRPSGEVADAVLKRPAAAAPAPPKAKAGRIPAPCGCAAKPPPKIEYKGAWIYTSWTKLAYRCILDPKVSASDNCFRWAVYGSREAAWTACLDFVDAKK